MNERKILVLVLSVVLIVLSGKLDAAFFVRLKQALQST